jgi:nicotinamidase-related amidase
LDADSTFVLVVDVQAKLFAAVSDPAGLAVELCRLIRGARVLGLPVVLAEQNPAGLGPTIPEVAGLLPDVTPLAKMSFSCCEDEGIMAALAALGRRQVLICGLEAHVCVYQTAVGLVANGYEVQVVADAVSSRTEANRRIGLGRARDAGAGITSVETCLFELLGVAEGPAFKEILRIVK